VFLVRYELGPYIPEDGILHSHRRENLKCLDCLYNCRSLRAARPHSRLIYLIFISDQLTIFTKQDLPGGT
jgi:hypothetical protein